MGSCLSADGWNSSSPPQPAIPHRIWVIRRSRRKDTSNSGTETKSKSDEELCRIPGRVLTNGATNIASTFTQQGRKGVNQDAMIVWENFGSRKNTIFCGVFDGHGPFGHLVARKVRDSLPLKLLSQLQADANDNDNFVNVNGNVQSMDSEDSTLPPVDIDPKEFPNSEDWEQHQQMFYTLKESILKAFRVMDKELWLHPTIDCFCSGTTAVTLIKQGKDLVIGNIGDSRAVLGTRADDNSLNAVQLTVDLKPDLPKEAERIRKCKGRVFALHDEPEVARVWLPNYDSPGLAMARAFGDFCLKEFGLISVPDVSYRRLTEKDEFIVLATDGIWDVLSNEEVIDIVASVPSRSSAARALVECAVRSWRSKYPTSKVDDCAVVCLFLHSPSHSEEDPTCGLSHCSIRDGVPKEASLMAAALSQESKGNDSQFSAEVDASLLDLTSSVNLTNHNGNSKCNVRSPSYRKASQYIVTEDGEEWHALESVTRVNSLLSIPRI